MPDQGALIRNYLRDIEERRIPQLRASLAPLLSGEMRLGERNPGQPWIDITQREVKLLEAAIADYEKIVENFRKQEEV